MLHTLFTLEHNHICDQLAHEHPDWTDEQLFAQGEADQLRAHGQDSHRRVDAGDPAASGHRVAMNVNWYGLAGEDLQEVARVPRRRRASRRHRRSHADHHTAPYSLTEEFVAVYRMHPLMPDDFMFRSVATGSVLETPHAAGVAGRTRPRSPSASRCRICSTRSASSHPGAITLHNYPRHLQNLTRDNGEHLDLAAVDILRDRERGVPRYNQFRRLMHKEPVKSFDEITDNAEWRAADQEASTTTTSRRSI